MIIPERIILGLIEDVMVTTMLNLSKKNLCIMLQLIQLSVQLQFQIGVSSSHFIC